MRAVHSTAVEQERIRGTCETCTTSVKPAQLLANLYSSQTLQRGLHQALPIFKDKGEPWFKHCWRESARERERERKREREREREREKREEREREIDR